MGGDGICLFSDGVVALPNGRFVAVFGYDNPSASSLQPAINQVSANPVANPSPAAPPGILQPGTHTAAYLPEFGGGQTITWTVNGESVTADASLSTPRLPTVPIGGNGLGVVIGGQTIVLQADTNSYATPPSTEPIVQAEPPVGEQFNGALTGTFGVSPSGASTYTVPISLPPGVAGMSPRT